MILLSNEDERKTTPARRPHIETLFILVFARTRHRARGMSASPTRPRGLVPPPRRARSPRRPPARARAMSSESPGASPARPAFSSLPVLTLPPPGCSRAAEAAFAAELREVCHTVGFFYVAGIDAFVSPTTRRDALAAATRFFAMPQDKKDAMDYRNSPAFRGYVRLGAENTAGLPDLREQVEFGVEEETRPMATDAPPYARLRGPNQWPNEIDCPRFRENASRFSDEARALSTRLTRLLALY